MTWHIPKTYHKGQTCLPSTIPKVPSLRILWSFIKNQSFFESKHRADTSM